MISIQDTTIRDGLQEQGVKKDLQTKKKMLKSIIKSPINSIEIGMCTTQEDKEDLLQLIEIIPAHIIPVVLTRINLQDVKLSGSLAKYHSLLTLKLLIPVSQLHVEVKLGTTYQEFLNEVEKILEYCHDQKLALEIVFEDSTRADKTIIERFIALCNHYKIQYITLADTVGISTPDQYYVLMESFVNQFPEVNFSTHTHNDFGVATANTIMGIKAGAKRIETTFLGLGERAGNAALEEVCGILAVNNECEPEIYSTIVQTAKEILEILEISHCNKKPFLGEKCFVHESGIHQDGMLKDIRMYQPYDPVQFGLLDRSYTFGISGISSKRIINQEYKKNIADPCEMEEFVDFYRKYTKKHGLIEMEVALEQFTMLGKRKMKIVENIETVETQPIIQALDEGYPIIIPTDTNYNLCCLPTSHLAIDRIFEYKQRPKDKPLSLFMYNPSDWEKYGEVDNPELMKRIVQAFWPGPLNIVVKNKTNYNYMLNGGDTIALGCVANETHRALLKQLNTPIAITSANISGTADDTLVTAEFAMQQMSDKVPYLIKTMSDIKTTKSSTIISLIGGKVSLLREGDIKFSDILEVAGV